MHAKGLEQSRNTRECSLSHQGEGGKMAHVVITRSVMFRITSKLQYGYYSLVLVLNHRGVTLHTLIEKATSRHKKVPSSIDNEYRSSYSYIIKFQHAYQICQTIVS